MKPQHLLAIVLAVILARPANSHITFPKSSEQSFPADDHHHLHSSHDYGTAQDLAYHVANLGLRTLRDLVPGHGNVIISPLNVYSCLGILGLGASGTTRDEIEYVLGPRHENLSLYVTTKADGVSYSSALFLDDHFTPRPEFVDSAVARYQTSVLNVNVTDGETTKTTINRWVSDHTNGTITNLLQEYLDPNTRMVVVSALLFNGKWLQSFSPAATTPGKFQVDEGITVDVNLMHLAATVPVVRSPILDAIGLPYQEHGMQMYLILPKAHGVDNLKRLLSHLNVNSLKKLRSDSVPKESMIIVPKLKIDGRYSLTKSLQQSGISAMFDPSRANFTNLAYQDFGLFASDIYHSVHFEMNEQGTTASAATAGIFTKSSKFVFRANRPFIVVITTDADLILFMGAVTSP